VPEDGVRPSPLSLSPLLLTVSGTAGREEKHEIGASSPPLFFRFSFFPM